MLQPLKLNLLIRMRKLLELLIEKLADKLATEIGEVVLGSVYPIRIVNASSSQVVLGQGGKTVKSGDFFKVYQLGKN